MENKEKKRFLHRWWFWSAVVLVIFAAAGGVFLVRVKPAGSMDAEMALMTELPTNAPDELMTSSVTPAPESAAITLINPERSAEAIEALPVFGFDIEEWVGTISGLNTSVGLPALFYKDVVRDPGQFTINQSEYVFYMGRLNQNSEAYSLMLGGFGDGKEESSAEILLSMALFVASLHPEYAPSDSGAVISDLGLLGDAFPDAAALVRDGTSYEFVNDPEFGILFFASPVVEE